MVGSPGTPLPSSSTVEFPPPIPATPEFAGPTPPPRRPRRWGRIVVVIVVVVLILGVISYLSLGPSPDVLVTGINFSSPDNTCGLDGATDYGFNASSGTSMEFTYEISGNNTTSGGSAACTIHSVSTTTAGFSISGANVPLSIPVNSSQLLSFSVNMPGSSYTGILTLVIT